MTLPAPAFLANKAFIIPTGPAPKITISWHFLFRTCSKLVCNMPAARSEKPLHHLSLSVVSKPLPVEDVEEKPETLQIDRMVLCCSVDMCRTSSVRRADNSNTNNM